MLDADFLLYTAEPPDLWASRLLQFVEEIQVSWMSCSAASQLPLNDEGCGLDAGCLVCRPDPFCINSQILGVSSVRLVLVFLEGCCAWYE